MKLSPQQQQAFDLIMRWHKSPQQRFVLAGYAGAGKTTLAKKIARAIEGTIFCAFTGKAAQVLREKGCAGAGTIHGFIYALEEQAAGQRPRFSYDPKSEWRSARLIIVDEYSMLSKDLIDDIERDGRKILYLGDPAQLPPVNGRCPLEPDFFIEEIHRQALDSAIIRFSKIVREGAAIPFGDHGDLKYLPQRQTCPELYMEADQIIVGRNHTRSAWNKKFRKLNQFVSPLPVVGDKIICLRNNRESGLYNGLIGRADNNCDAEGAVYYLNTGGLCGIPVWSGDVLGQSSTYDAQPGYIKSLDRFDYSYCITAHKSQGSEFDSVLVYNQPGADARKWLYTSLTRAKKNCVLVEPA